MSSPHPLPHKSTIYPFPFILYLENINDTDNHPSEKAPLCF
jgi:hypothetical protein